MFDFLPLNGIAITQLLELLLSLLELTMACSDYEGLTSKCAAALGRDYLQGSAVWSSYTCYCIYTGKSVYIFEQFLL